MKIAIHNPRAAEATGRHISDALNRKGVQTAYFEYPKLFWLKSIQALRPDWILMSSNDVGFRMITKNHIQKIRSALPTAKIAFWTFDTMNFGDNETWFIPLGKSVDAVFSKEMELFSKYRALGINIYYLDQGVVQGTPFGEEPRPEWMCDVGFVGGAMWGTTLRPGIKLVQDLARKVDLKIWSKDRGSWEKLGLGSKMISTLSEKDWPKLAASARIVMGIDAASESEGCWSNRVYHALGSGCFYLSRYNKGFETIFKRGEHMDWFLTDAEAMEKIDHYLGIAPERERIRRNGYRHVHQFHTYDQRVEQFLEVLKKA